MCLTQLHIVGNMLSALGVVTSYLIILKYNLIILTQEVQILINSYLTSVF